VSERAEGFPVSFAAVVEVRLFGSASAPRALVVLLAGDGCVPRAFVVVCETV
jgi:hypothetical protein